MYNEKIEFEKNTPFTIKIQSINRYSTHWHENITEIILPIKGSVEVNSSFERNIIHEGDFWFINNKYIHSIDSPDNTIVAIFHINLGYFEKQFEYIKYTYFRSNVYSENPNGTNDYLDCHIRLEYKKRFRNLLINILSDFINYNKSLEELGEKYEYRLIYSMVYEFNWLQFQRESNKFIHQELLDRYHRIVKFVDENYSERITLDDIVAREFITKNYFSHFWKNLSSYSFQEYISYERVRKSEYLLLNNVNISSISEQCGFSDVKYYYRHFKRWYRCMPIEHRDRCLSYIKMGFDYFDFKANDSKSIFDDYTNNYFISTYDHILDSDISFFVENYIKAKYLYSKDKDITSNSSKHIIINLFNHINFYLEEKECNFNWNNIDLLVNLSLDNDVPIYFRLACDNIDRELLYDSVNSFIDNCIFRYGMKTLNKWQFFINFKDISLYKEADDIRKIIYKKVKNPKVDFSFEF